MYRTAIAVPYHAYYVNNFWIHLTILLIVVAFECWEKDLNNNVYYVFIIGYVDCRFWLFGYWSASVVWIELLCALHDIIKKGKVAVKYQTVFFLMCHSLDCWNFLPFCDLYITYLLFCLKSYHRFSLSARTWFMLPRGACCIIQVFIT